MRAALDFSKEPFEDVVGADGLLVFLRIGIQGQAGLQITLQARNGGRIDFLVFVDESSHSLISGLPILLVEQGFQLRFDLLLLFIGNRTEDVVHLVNHTALTSRGGKLLRDRTSGMLVRT